MRHLQDTFFTLIKEQYINLYSVLAITVNRIGQFELQTFYKKHEQMTTISFSIFTVYHPNFLDCSFLLSMARYQTSAQDKSVPDIGKTKNRVIWDY